MESRTDQFHLLLQVLQSNGQPFMTGSFTGRAVAEMVQKYKGSHPVEVEVMNDHDVIIQFEPTVSVGKLLDSSMGHMTGLAKWPRSVVYFPPRRV